MRFYLLVLVMEAIVGGPVPVGATLIPQNLVHCFQAGSSSMTHCSSTLQASYSEFLLLGKVSSMKDKDKKKTNTPRNSFVLFLVKIFK